MTTLLHDTRFALRQLRKSPAFTGVAVLTLALGIGANTAIFTVVNALLLKMLPVRDPQQLVIVGNPTWANAVSNGTPSTENFSYPLYKQLRDHNSVFSGLCAAASGHGIEIETAAGEAFDQKISGRMVSGNYFSLLGLEPAAGRLISDPDDTAENANPVVVLGYSYWQRRFDLSSSIIGKDIRLNGYPFTVIGVAPANFDGDVVGERMSLFVPLSMQPAIVRGRRWRNAPNTSWLSLIGRLNPGTSPAQAEANLNGVFQQAVGGDYGASLSSDDRGAIRELHIKIQVSEGGGGISHLRGDYRTPLLLLMGIVGLVLLIACVNVANLLLSRASMRNREFAVRLAIGANRARVFQQLLTESILLALLGGIAGSLLAFWGVRFLVGMLGSNTALRLSPDAHVLGFSLAISLLTGILFGMFPALRSMRVRVSPALIDATRATKNRGSRFAWGKVLIAGQVALSLLVLFAASLLVRSLQKLITQDFGYRRDHLLIAKLDPSAYGYAAEKMKPLAQRLVSALGSTPGISSVTYSTNGLFAGTESDDALLIPGFTSDSAHDRVAKEDYVGPNYFKVLGIPILSGRGIEDQDSNTSTRVAVVNEAMVKRFFHGENPIGRQFRIDDADWLDKPITIVGVSHNAKDHGVGLREEVEPRFYVAFQQMKDPVQIVIEAQVSGAPSAAAASVISQIKSVEPHIPMEFVQTLESRVNETAANQIALAKLSAFFGGLALLLACVGLYGVMSYSVAGRIREIGVRMALGARRADVLQLVLREGMFLVILGIAVGIPLSLASSRLLHSFLFGLKPTDPLSLIAVVLLLGAVAAMAGTIPARRAAKVDPMVALRYE
jgi:predicted permease